MQVSRNRFPIPWILPWATGRYYCYPAGGTLTTGAPGAASIFANAFYVPNPAGVTVTSIGVEITVAGTAGHVARFSIYRDEVGKPGELIVDGGTVAVDPGAVPDHAKVTVSQYLPQGWYWTAFSTQSATFRISSSGTHFPLYSKQDEASVTNSPMSHSASPATTVMTMYTTVGHPEKFPGSVVGRPVHANAVRVLIGI